jgi:hypothetical protein
MKPNLMLTSGFQELVCALDIRFYKRARIDNRIVIMGLSGIVNNCIVPGNQSIKQIQIANVANNELNPVLRKPGNAVRISGIGQLIQDSDVCIRNVAHDIANKRRAAKTTAARNQDIAVFSLHAHRPHLAMTCTIIPIICLKRVKQHFPLPPSKCN